MRNLKTVIALVAVFAMMLTTVAFAQSFTDVDEGHDYYEAIEMLSNLGIITGDDQDGDGRMDFRPSDTITRAEVAVIISRIQNVNNAAQAPTPFTDVPASHWASGYIAQAAGQGIVNGYGDGTFGPEDKVLYEQVIKMVVETLGYTPFVEVNGGYYTGHLTAAQRYGILDGVVGGSVGAEASRGQVAQIVYNAIDTPLMDRYTYGKDAEYVIFNGKGDYDYMSLLTRDLGVKKFSGIVTENQVTGITAVGDAIDTEDEAEVAFAYDDNDDYYNYEIKDIDTIYAGDSNVGELIGKHVNVYVKEGDRNGEYVVVSAAETNKNKVVSFTLDAFDKFDGNNIYYYKNESDRTSTSLKIDNGFGNSATSGIIFNGVAYDKDLKLAFGDETAKGVLVWKDSPWSGKVTLIDNNTTAGYDVVYVEIGAPAVIDEVSTVGAATFKDTPVNVEGDTITVDFDETITDQIIKLTKDGEPVDYTELKEWDVVSILYNAKAEYYDVRVVGANKIDGSIRQRASSSTSADKYEYTINGTKYDVAQNAYGTKSSGWNPGTSGSFYVDEYGKIVAYDKDGTATASDKYAYVLAATDVTDDWGNANIRVQVLDKSGEVYEAYLASRVKIEYPGSVGLTATELGAKFDAESATYDVEDLSAAGIKALADAMVNQLITYESNTAREIRTITFPQGDEDESSLYLADQDEFEYDEEDMALGRKFDLAEDTLVFFIKGSTTIAGLGDGAAADKTMSKVGTAATIATGTYKAAVYDVENDVPAVVVLFNTSGGISPSSNVAVIDKVGQATYEGDDVLSVTYLMGGEKKTSYTDPDLVNIAEIEKAERGAIFKFALNADGTVITDAEWYGTFERYANGFDAGEAGDAKMTWKTPATDEIFYFGPVYDYTSASKRIRLAADNNGKWEFGNTQDNPLVRVSATGANVYIFEPARNNNKLYVGDAANITADEKLIEKTTAVWARTNGDKLVDADEMALGMMDYVAAVEYDGDILDVVVYKGYDFGRYTFTEPK